MLFAGVPGKETEEIEFSSAFPDVFSMVSADAKPLNEIRDVDTP